MESHFVTKRFVSPRDQSLLLTFGRAASGLVAALVPVVMVHVLEQEKFGEYRQLLLIVTTAASILQLGMPGSLYYFVPRSPHSSQALMRRSVALLLLTGMFGAVGFQILGGGLEAWFPISMSEYSLLLAVFLLFATPADLIAVLPTVDRRAGLQAILLIGSELSKGVLLVAAVLVVGSVRSLLCVAVAVAVVQFGLVCAYLAQRGQAAPNEHSVSLGAQFAYALPLFGAGLVGLVRDQSHAFYVAGHVAPDQFAIYVIGTLSLPLMSFLNQTIGDVMLMQNAANFTAGRLPEMRRIWFRSLRALALCFLPTFAIMQVFAGDLIIGVFGDDYAVSADILRVYLGLLPAYVLLLTSPMLKSTGDLKTQLAAEVVSTVVTVGSVIIAPPLLGLPGAALAPVLGYVSYGAFASMRVAERLELTPLSMFSWRYFIQLTLLGLISAGIPWFALLALSPLTRLAVGAPLAGGIFLLAAWRCGLIEESERALVAGWIAPLRRFLR